MKLFVIVNFWINLVGILLYCVALIQSGATPKERFSKIFQLLCTIGYTVWAAYLLWGQ